MRTCLFAGAARLVGIAAWCGAAVLGSTANGAAAPLGSTLMGMLPQGFSAANCREVKPKRPELEKVTCSQSTDPAGPVGAEFALFANPDDLAAGFAGAGGTIVIAPSCPAGQPSPGPWNSGMVECGAPKRDQKLSAVAWTNNTKLVVGGVWGPDMDLLYQWWRANSG